MSEFLPFQGLVQLVADYGGVIPNCLVYVAEGPIAEDSPVIFEIERSPVPQVEGFTYISTTAKLIYFFQFEQKEPITFDLVAQRCQLLVDDINDDIERARREKHSMPQRNRSHSYSPNPSKAISTGW